MVLAVLIFLFTLVLVIWQPKLKWQPHGLGIGWSASLGALLALLTGVVSVTDIPVVWDIVWNATITFVALIIISLILDEGGFFKWAALHVARWGGGRGRLLFPLVILLGAAVSALFANDGTALILTPIVLAMLTALGFRPAATLAFILATGFIADSASLPLVISNLVNIVSADYFDLGFGEYASVMVPVDIAAVLASLGMLYWMFRRDLPGYYDPSTLEAPGSAIRDPAVFKVGWIVLGVLLVGYFAAGPLGIPVSVVAVLGAVLLWLVAARGKAVSTRAVLKGAPWQIVLFSLGMYLVVYGLRNAGLTDLLAGVLDRFAAGGLWSATLGTGVLTAVLASVMNNLPSVLIGALAIDASSATGAVKQGMIYANVVGNDLGPKITPIGSLATLLWLHVLATKGVRISWGQYFKVGIVLTLPVLLVTLAALALRLS
ncbi:arsenic transporter [Deinococcus radiopugnans]|uniref:Arsenical pump membrane protein n=1 Tax=Deinococcus radiopugnans ATCC 19172 TaxID=585398 RepID=A0A5C4YA89_9DEIO|nr:arsenic transporter [Deinococcus radiopugnans]MBB6017448.1 arsenical pump membrane protein [Deinococcus radiopugnans ATCC 19172]TNM71976.1 arsenic transporter [Deinococcus radiopugnans ATCC 19172]